MTIAKQLFSDYNYYRRHTAQYKRLKQINPHFRDYKETPQRLKLFENLADWCKERRINPRQWLYSLFESRRWTFTPPLKPGYLLSKKHLTKYKVIENYALYKRRVREDQEIQEKLDQDNPNRWDPRRDLNNTVEKTKRYYLRNGGPDQCMSAMETETFGYHPKSQICSSCPAQTDCMTRLQSRVNYDIQAVRRGVSRVSDATKEAAKQVNAYGQ